MIEGVENYLYRHPELYEIIYPEPNDETPEMCRRMFRQFLPTAPKSILDIGCGTGRDLGSLARDGAECVGVDCLPEAIDYARSYRPRVSYHVGDMREFRLGRSFDAILCMGSAFMYALTRADVDAALETFVAHAHEGTLLILDINNAAACLPGGSFQDTSEFEVRLPEFTAKATSTYTFDHRRQLMIRHRTWEIPGQPAIEDYCRYRLSFPAELERLLETSGFRVVGMFDNMELEETDLAGGRLYTASVFGM